MSIRVTSTVQHENRNKNNMYPIQKNSVKFNLNYIIYIDYKYC